MSQCWRHNAEVRYMNLIFWNTLIDLVWHYIKGRL